jgi:LemA protein
MDSGLVTTIIVIGVVVVILVVLGILYWSTYHSVVALKTRVDTAWGEITAGFHARAELIPTIVDTVQGVAGHEKTAFASITSARDETLAAPDASTASVAETHMQKAIRGVFKIAEGYPQLQTSQQFLQLQSDLASTEDKIQSARRFYNGGVRELNTKIKGFPGSTVAKNRGFGQAEFFETNEPSAVAEPPRVQF